MFGSCHPARSDLRRWVTWRRPVGSGRRAYDVESDPATLESSGLAVEVKSHDPDGSGPLL
ncbi:MAG TPA: hypothetical protein VGM40_05650 [Mycobacterium sp.]|jgi:hypothetical protein